MKFRKVAACIRTAGFVIVTASSAGLAADSFQGVWKVTDTTGKPFEITLSGNGKATATTHGMSGTWKEQGKMAVITWNTGWTTEITKEDDHYRHTAYRKGQSAPANTSDAEKVK